MFEVPNTQRMVLVTGKDVKNSMAGKVQRELLNSVGHHFLSIWQLSARSPTTGGDTLKTFPFVATGLSGDVPRGG